MKAARPRVAADRRREDGNRRGELASVVLNLREVASYLRVCSSTVSKMAARGEIRSFKVGARRRFNREHLDEWVHARSLRGSEPGGPAQDQEASADRRAARANIRS
jgi:excisionase family DNA binding protein